MHPKAILFDLDDTIIAFEAVSESTWRHVCEAYADRSALFTADGLFEAIEGVRTWYWSDPARHKGGRLDLNAARRRIVSLALSELGVDAASLAGEIADAYSAAREEAIEFFPGAEDVLRYFVGRGVQLALITNGEAGKQRRKVERFGLERFFSTILIEGELGYGKPEDRIYLGAMKALDVRPAETWSVGDNLEWDVGAPQRLGVRGIWNDFRKVGLPCSSPVTPDRIIHGISELIEESERTR